MNEQTETAANRPLHGVECYEAWCAHEDCPHEQEED